MKAAKVMWLFHRYSTQTSDITKQIFFGKKEKKLHHVLTSRRNRRGRSGPPLLDELTKANHIQWLVITSLAKFFFFLSFLLSLLSCRLFIFTFSSSWRAKTVKEGGCSSHRLATPWIPNYCLCARPRHQKEEEEKKIIFFDCCVLDNAN